MGLTITWIGHSCFKIEKDGFAIVTDPYEDGYVPGLAPLKETANLVLTSHGHGDHNARSKVKLTEGKASPFRVSRIETWHDEVRGAKRGPNTIHIIETDGFRIAHLGDLGCELEKDQIEQLRGLDVCLIPVGGHYTIDGVQAAELVRRIEPRTVIPMHYRDDEDGFGFDVISPVDVFADEFGSVLRTGQSVFDADDVPEEQVVILRPRDLRS